MNRWTLKTDAPYIKNALYIKFLFINFTKIKEQLIFDSSKLLQNEQWDLLFSQILCNSNLGQIANSNWFIFMGWGRKKQQQQL